jgi:pimeloyl-ACP methyl ester carboxylesterase
MRGYNLSSKPDRVGDYSASEVARDIVALADHFGAQRFSVVGHDWGGVIAWRVASLAPDRVRKLVIINAPHPALMMRELLDNPRQRAASAYIGFLRMPGAHRLLRLFGFRLLRSILDRGLNRGYFNQADADAYLEAWSQPGAMRGMVNYYRAAPPLRRDRSHADVPTGVIDIPTLVIWGEQDRYLRAELLDGLKEYVSDLRVQRIPEGSHWIVHEKPDLINSLLRKFLQG